MEMTAQLSLLPGERTRISADVGETLALELVNTASMHLSATPGERLVSWRAFARWAAEQSLVPTDALRPLLARDHSIAGILSLREALFRIALCAIRAKEPEVTDVALVTTAASGPLPAAAWQAGRLRWRFDPDDVATQLTGLVACDALNLFASDRLARVRVCDGDDCGWLFLDESRGRPRRWCSMSDCGNRAKAREAYQRKRAMQTATGPDGK